MLNKEELKQLRSEVSLFSLYYSDFENSLGIDSHKCSDFFDGFAEYIEERIYEIYGETKDSVVKDDLWGKHWQELDNIDELWDWYGCFDDDPLAKMSKSTQH